jgi:ribosomal protein S19
MKIKKSSWKYPFNIIKRSVFKNKLEGTFTKCLNRNLTLTTKLLDQTVKCHKGKTIGKLIIGQQHLGYKLGSFFITKVLGERIAYRKKQKLLLKKQKQKQKQKQVKK